MTFDGNSKITGEKDDKDSLDQNQGNPINNQLVADWKDVAEMMKVELASFSKS